jgi:hypothetical protein
MLEIYILVIAYFVVMFTVIALLGKYTVLDMDIDLSDSSEAIFAVYIGLVWPFSLVLFVLAMVVKFIGRFVTRKD